jgi:hypothetical protein
MYWIHRAMEWWHYLAQVRVVIVVWGSGIVWSWLGDGIFWGRLEQWHFMGQ